MIRKIQDSAEGGCQVPSPRFGHTTTLVGHNTVVLFGGATGDGGHYIITRDTYVFDLTSHKWSLLPVEGNSTTIPSARAAHAAACVDSSQLVIYGGAMGGGSLSMDELYLLDFTTKTWMCVPVTAGASPGRRYGHTMIFHKPLLMVFGGNNGKEAVNDVWVLDVENTPFAWNQISLIHPRVPAARVYHSADICREGPASGMMVVFGGRTVDARSLKDIWGLRQHRDQRWDWVEAPTKRGNPPEARFQHASFFCNTTLFIIGGRGSDVSRQLPTMIYCTETCEWQVLSTTVCNRFRHSIWGVPSAGVQLPDGAPPMLYTYGGFDHAYPSQPTNEMHMINLEIVLREIGQDVNAKQAGESKQGAAFAPQSQTTAGTNAAVAPTQLQNTGNGSLHPNNNNNSNHSDIIRPSSKNFVGAGDIKLSNEVFVAMDKDFTHLVRKINIDSLEDESKKIDLTERRAVSSQEGLTRIGIEGKRIAELCIERLLKPTSWQPDPAEMPFFLHPADVLSLCDAVTEILQHEEMVIKLRAPIKVYGDIHGQYLDLMRLFARYKAPTENEAEGGDIDSMDYLFLGDFVDRGSFSLEVVVLLFALKVKHPRQIHLIRGNHEDATINSIYGFRVECQRRLQEDPDEASSCWGRFNATFEWLPCGALIENRIICIHGGLGGTIGTIEDIESIKRPLKVAQIPQNADEQKVTDLLWSDPSDSDYMEGVTANDTRDPDGTGKIVKFGPDRVRQFCEANKLALIIRAHECVMDGFERFAGGMLITVFSATDYCGHHKNAGALLFIRRDLTVVPKLIYPNERQLTSTWDSKVTSMRPPTPPRAAPRTRGFETGEW